MTVKRSKYVVPEKNVHKQVAEYLRLAWPKVLFRTDMGGIRLTMGQAVQNKKQQNGMKWPDIFIAEPKEVVWTDKDVPVSDMPGWRVSRVERRAKFPGLFIELKKDGTNLVKRNGEWASDHIKQQALCMEKLRAKGYDAQFAVGFNEAKKIIDNYLG